MENKSSSDYESVHGRCLDMCPESEMKFREANRLLSLFEVMDGHEKIRHPKCDPTKCVKEFRRSAAGEKLNDADQLRPAKVLLQTVDYLLAKIATRRDVPFDVVYDFVFDRLRSVRQDMVIQQIHLKDPHLAACIIEKCYRFYAFALFVIKRYNLVSIDRHIHRTHMKQCLQSLVEIYRSFPVEKTLNNSSEFLACYVIFNSESNIFEEFLMNFSKGIRMEEPLQTAIQLYRAVLQNNFVRVFKLFSLLKSNEYYLPLLSFIENIQKYRTKVVSVLSHSHNSKQCSFPPEILLKWLLLSDRASVLQICAGHGMNVNEKSHVIFQKSNFSTPHECNVQESFIDSFESLQDMTDKVILSHNEEVVGS
ncbi:germinal-center associated nuclear protein-like [Styela clava]